MDDKRTDALIEYLMTRLSAADHRLRELDKYPVCNKARVVLQEGHIKQIERDIVSLLRGY